MPAEDVSSQENVLGHSRIFTPEVINDIHVKAELGRYRMPASMPPAWFVCRSRPG